MLYPPLPCTVCSGGSPPKSALAAPRWLYMLRYFLNGPGAVVGSSQSRRHPLLPVLCHGHGRGDPRLWLCVLGQCQVWLVRRRSRPCTRSLLFTSHIGAPRCSLCDSAATVQGNLASMGIAQGVMRLRERPLPVDEIASTTVQLLPHVEWCKMDNAEREYLLRRGTHILAVLIAVSLFIILVLGVYIAVLKSSQCPDPQANATGEASRAENANSEVLPPCGEDWIWFRNKCYFFSEKEANWTDAEDECATFRASLAEIENQPEMDFMRRYIGEIDHWIGLRRESGQPWRWVNGTEFSNWFIIEDYSDCAFLNSIAGSGECYSILNWICTTKERVDERKGKDR